MNNIRYYCILILQELERKAAELQRKEHELQRMQFGCTEQVGLQSILFPSSFWLLENFSSYYLQVFKVRTH